MKEGRISTQSVSSVQEKVKTFTAAYKAGIVQEDLVNDATPGPVRYAFAVPVNYTLGNSGTWHQPIFDELMQRIVCIIKLLQ
jgi:hypothetical protein